MTQQQVLTNPPSHGRSVALWAGVLGSPVVWAVQFQAGYMLVPWTCRTHDYFVLHLVTLVALLLVAVGAYLSWRDWKRVGGGSPESTDGGPIPRIRFLGALGVVVSVMFWLLILAQGISSFFFSACWT